MRLVVAATDFSALAEAAARRAARLGAAAGARLALLHVAERHGFDVSRATERAKLRQAAARLRAEHALEVEEYFAYGSPSAEIAAFAERAHADLVVIGAPGGGLRTRTGWSTAQRVRRRTSVPVLAVRRESGSAYRRVLATTDLSPASEAALAWYARVFPHAELHILHVCPPGFGGALPPGRPASVMRQLHRRQALRRAGRALWQLAYRCGLATARLHLEIGEPAPVIRQRTTDLGADLLVLSPASRPGLSALVFPSVSAGVLARAGCDALFIHPRTMRLDELVRHPRRTPGLARGGAAA